MGFKLLEAPSLYVFVEFLVVKLNFHLQSPFEDVQKILVYVTKMIMHDYQLLTQFPMKYLGASAIYICLKIMEQIAEQTQTRTTVERLKTLLNLDEQRFFQSSEALLGLAKNFERRFSFSRNLIKFDSFSLEK